MKHLKKWCRIASALLMATPLCAFAASAANEFETPAKNLIELVFTFIKYGGILLSIWGLVQFFIAMNNHDSTQKMGGAWMFLGGIAMVFLKSMLNGIGVTW